MDDLQKELDLYKKGNIDELIVLMDEEEKHVPRNQTNRSFPNTAGRSHPSLQGMPTHLPSLSRPSMGTHLVRPTPSHPSHPSHPSANFRPNPMLKAESRVRTGPFRGLETGLELKPESRIGSGIGTGKGSGKGLEPIRIEEEVESNFSTNTNKTTKSKSMNKKIGNPEVTSNPKLNSRKEDDTQSETDTIINGRVRRAKPDLETTRRLKPVKPVAGIDENWFLQKTEEGINLLDYTGKLPLSVPNEDVLNLNSVRSAARTALRKKNDKRSEVKEGNTVATADTVDTAYSASTTDIVDKVNEVYSPIPAISELPNTNEMATVTDTVSNEVLRNEVLRNEVLGTEVARNEFDVNSMLDSGTQLLSKVRNLLKSNVPIPPNGLEGIEEEVDPNKPIVPEEKILELHEVQDKWIELDNEIKGIRALIKDLQAKQRELSEYLKSEMLKYQIPHLKSLQGDKIILKSQNRKGTYKKDYIFTKLQEFLQDPEMAANLSDHLENGRPISESINLSRSKK